MAALRTGQSTVVSGLAISFFIVLMALLAPLGVLGGKGLTLALVLMGLIAIVDLVRLQRLAAIFSPRWLVVILALLVLWAALGSFATQGKITNLSLFARLLALSVLGLAVHAWLAELPPFNLRRLENGLLIGLWASVVLVVVYFIMLKFGGQQLWGSNALDRLASVRPGAAVISVLIWPCALILWRRGRTGLTCVFVTVALIGVVPGGAAMVSLLAGAAAFMLVHVLGRRGRMLIGAGLVAFVMLLPTFFQRGPSTADMIQALPSLSSSAQHRLYIWDFTSQKITESPLIGWGFDSSRMIPGGNDAAPIGTSLMPLHPHSAALQVWLELGLPGALLMAAFFGFYFIRGSQSLDATPYAAARSAMLVTLIGNAMLSYGVWQNWWVATMWLLPAAFDAVARDFSDRQSSDRTTTSD